METVSISGSITASSNLTGSAGVVYERAAKLRAKSILNLNANSDKILQGVKDAVLETIKLGSSLIAITATGFYAYNIDSLELVSYGTLANTVCGAVNSSGLYIGTSNAGVFFISQVNIETAGDRTGSIALKWSTATPPSIQSNVITCLAGNGVAALIGNASGLAYIPVDSNTTKYTATAANVEDCSLSSTHMAYIVAGVAYARTVPSANFTVIAGDQSVVAPIIVDNVSNASPVYMTGNVELAGAAGTHVIKWDYDTIQVYVINGDGSVTLTDTINPTLTIMKATARGDYIFVYEYNSGGSSARLEVFKRSGNTYPLLYTSGYHNYIYNGGYDMWVNDEGTKIFGETGFTRSVETYDPDNLYGYWTRSGDTITDQGTCYINTTVIVHGWSADGNYSITTDNHAVGFRLVPLPSGDPVFTRAYYGGSGASSFARLGSNYFVTMEKLNTTGADTWWLCLYSFTTTTITALDKIALGVDEITPDIYYIDKSVNVINGYIVVSRSHQIWGSYKDEEVTTEIFEVIANVLVAVNSTIPLIVADTAVTLTGASTKGTRVMARATDASIITGTQLGISLQFFDHNAGTAPDYGTANCIELETDIFVGTDEGLLIQGTAGGAYSKLAGSLGSNKNVVAIQPSSAAEQATGYVIYAVDDQVGNAKVGVIDLDNSLAFKPEDLVLTSVNDVWMASETSFGYDHTGFVLVPLGTTLDAFISWHVKESGAFNPHPIFVKVDSKFLPVADAVVVRFYLDTASPQDVLSITILGKTFNYTVVTSIDDALTAFVNILNTLGFKAEKDLTNDFLDIQGPNALFITMPTAQVLDKKLLPKYNIFSPLFAISDWSATWSFTTV